MSPPHRPARQSGFTLLEALIALVLLGVALLMGMELVLANPRIVRRTDAQRQAFRALESTLEAVRAGAIPLVDQQLDGFVTAVGTPAPRDLNILMEVEPTEPAGLVKVTLKARYNLEGRKFEKEIQTLVWNPPKEH
jgi:prepilin-type N-terminal cleavage/methylation domain-containing protein